MTDRSATPAGRIALLLVTGFFLGAGFPVSKLAGGMGVPPLAFAFWSYLGGGLAIAVFSALRGDPPRLTPVHLRYYVVLGFLSIGAPNAVLFSVVPHLGAGLTGVAYSLPPLMTLFLAAMFGIERMTAWRSAGILFGLAGCLALVLPRTALPSPAALPFLVMALLSPILISAGNIVRTLAWPPGASPMALAGGMIFVSSLWIGAVALGFGQTFNLFTGGVMAALVLVLQMAMTAVTFACFFILQRIAGPVYLSQVGYVATMTSIAGGLAMFGEQVTVWMAVALALIVTGIALANRRG